MGWPARTYLQGSLLRESRLLLHAAGLPELIAKTEQEHEEMALRIATEPKPRQIQGLQDSKKQPLLIHSHTPDLSRSTNVQSL